MRSVADNKVLRFNCFNALLHSMLAKVKFAKPLMRWEVEASYLSAMGSRYPCSMLGACVCSSFRRSCKVALKHMQQMLETSRGR